MVQRVALEGRKNVLVAAWRKADPAPFERVLEHDGMITRVSSDQPGFAWGEGVAEALRQSPSIVEMPAEWLAVLPTDNTDTLQIVRWSDRAVRSEEQLRRSDLVRRWPLLTMHSTVFLCDGVEVEVDNDAPVVLISPLHVDLAPFALIERKKSPIAKHIVKATAVGITVLGALSWLGDDPPPPSATAMDPWHDYRLQWAPTASAGFLFQNAAEMCAIVPTYPGAEAIVRVGIGSIISAELGNAAEIHRPDIEHWAQTMGGSISYSGGIPVFQLSRSPPIARWGNAVLPFEALDRQVLDSLASMSKVMNITVAPEPRNDNQGVWSSRAIRMKVQLNPWALNTLATWWQSLPVWVPSGSLQLTRDGDTCRIETMIQYAGRIQ